MSKSKVNLALYRGLSINQHRRNWHFFQQRREPNLADSFIILLLNVVLYLVTAAIFILQRNSYEYLSHYHKIFNLLATVVRNYHRAPTPKTDYN